MKNNATSNPNDSLAALTFSLSGKPYALAIEDVMEVASMVELATMPDSPAELRGIANRHGIALPILDLRLVLEQEAAPIDSSTLFIVAAHEGQIVGLVVDEVYQVEYMDAADRQPMPIPGKLIRDIVSHRGQLVQLISLPHLLAAYAGITDEGFLEDVSTTR